MDKFNKISELLQGLPDEFTSMEARHVLGEFYKAPDKLLEDLVRRSLLIRLKKGLFVLRERFEPFAAAGSVHRPSYLSFETALAFYEMIPERVNAIMSVADNRQLKLEAAGYHFIYRSQDRQLFALGMTATNIRGRNVLIATPEKALLDTIGWMGLNTKNIDQVEAYSHICGSLRLDTENLEKLSSKLLISLARLYRNRAPQFFVEELLRRKNHRKSR